MKLSLSLSQKSCWLDPQPSQVLRSNIPTRSSCFSSMFDEVEVAVAGGDRVDEVVSGSDRVDELVVAV